MFKSILTALAALCGASSQASSAAKKLQEIKPLSSSPQHPAIWNHLPAAQPSSYKTKGTRKAMRAAKKRRRIKAKLPK